VKQDARALVWTDVDSAEAELIRRCLEGEEYACAELVAQHQAMVQQLAFTLLGDHSEALDVSQDVFLRVFRTLDRFRGQSTLRTWIYRIVVNQARNRQRWWYRRGRAQQVSLDEHVERYGELPGRRSVSPDQVLGRKEQAVRIWEALERLPFDQKTAIVLREVEGLSYQEIAFSVGAVIGTVKSRLARARRTLRHDLRNER